MEFFIEDAKLVSSAPFSESGPYKGRAQIQPYVAEHLAKEVRVDLTKKQVSRDGVAWTLRARTGEKSANQVEDVAEAGYRGRNTKTLRLGSRTTAVVSS